MFGLGRQKTGESIAAPFVDIFQQYCRALKKVFDEQGVSFEKAGRLEVALFLLFRSDFYLQGCDNQSVRQIFFEDALRTIVPGISKDLLDLCYLRLGIYGQIYNECEDTKDRVLSKEFLSVSYDWLVSAVRLCRDHYNLMAKERFVPLSLAVVSDFPVKVTLQELDVKYTKQLLDYIGTVRRAAENPKT
jgi:hypothetical protein